jgi:hypothetical protein
MSKGILGALATLFAATGWAVAQGVLPSPRIVQEQSFAAGAIPAFAPSAVRAALETPRYPSPAPDIPLTMVPYLINNLGIPPAHPDASPTAYSRPECSWHENEVSASIWADVEYLLWWTRNGPLTTPLVTTGPAASQGVLGRPGTAVLFGGSGIDYDSFSGARFTLGLWHSDGQTLGMESSGFFLERRVANFAAASDAIGSPLLARPLVNPLRGAETAELVAALADFSGNIRIRSSSSLYGWDSNVLVNVVSRSYLSGDLLAGFRYLHLGEDLGIFQTSTLLPGGLASFNGNPITPPATLNIVDRFATSNQFYGGQLGARAEYAREQWFVHVLAKVGLGLTQGVGSIYGASILSGTGNPPMALPGGVLAVSSNTGRRVHDEFSVIPEVGINIGYQFTHCLRAFAGYTLLYWPNVARPGDLVNRTVNPTLIPTSQAFGNPIGPAQPTAALARTEFWAQGVNFGLEFRY